MYIFQVVSLSLKMCIFSTWFTNLLSHIGFDMKSLLVVHVFSFFFFIINTQFLSVQILWILHGYARFRWMGGPNRTRKQCVNSEIKRRIYHASHVKCRPYIHNVSTVERLLSEPNGGHRSSENTKIRIIQHGYLICDWVLWGRPILLGVTQTGVTILL